MLDGRGVARTCASDPQPVSRPGEGGADLGRYICATPLYETPFDAVASTYDKTFTYSRIGLAQREAVTRELHRTFRAGQRVLELNCGTGIDALRLANLGVEVMACDVSPRMIEVARRRAAQHSCGCISFRVLATEDLGRLRRERRVGEFDGAFSNFAGFNCVADLGAAARGLSDLLKPGAQFLLCVFGRFCAWEMLWYLGHGKPSKAFRRLRRTGAAVRLAERSTVRVQYPSVRQLTRAFAPWFKLRKWRGVGLAVPPSYLESLAARSPQILNLFSRLDWHLGSAPLIRSLGDHLLLTFERSGETPGNV